MADSPLPWKQGDRLASWVIESIQRHPEFVILSLARGRRRSRVEVTYHEGEPGEWTTSRYRVQPAPGEQTPVELLAAVLAALRASEATEGPPFVRRVRAETPATGPDPVEAKEGPDIDAVRAALAALDAEDDD